MNKLLAVLASNIVAASAFASSTEQSSPWSPMILLLVFFAIFYFLLIRPQMKRNKEQRKMMGELQKGDEVVTNSGIIGKIAKLGDNYIKVEIAENVNVKFQKQAVSNVLPKVSVKAE